MRYVTSTIAAVALASAVGVFAQEQQTPPREQAPQEQAAPREQAPTSTLTGCVVTAKTTDGATVYVLSRAEGGSAAMYILAGPTESQFSANVNKKIEVTGPVQEPPAADKDSAPDPKVARPPAVIVASVKVVADTCS